MDASGLKAEGTRWDLGELYTGPEDPRIEADLAEVRQRAEAFAQTYRGKVVGGELDGPALARALAEYEALSELEHRPSFYASLLFAADTQNPRAQQLVQHTREAATAVANVLVFFTLELIALDDTRLAALLAVPEMAEYRHYLEALRRFKPHTLSEKEEQILNQKHLTGSEAFEQLYQELTGSLRFRLAVDGEERDLTDGEILALLRHPDRGLRERAFATFLETHAGHSLVLTSVFNNILLDHKIDCELRHYDDVVTPTHLANEIAPETVAAMMQTVERHYPLAQEYFRLKARLLGLGRLKNTDLYAPIEAAAEKIPFPQARELILTAFGRFSEQFAAIAADFFGKRWIDAEVRGGKRGGAFCAALSPRHHPYVLCSYNGTSRDVSTVAHELGHGIHYSLSRRQNLFNYDAPLVLAETASVFAEIVLTRHLLSQTQSPAARRALLCDLLEEIYGTVFRQTALTRFEMAAHEKRRAGQLTADDLGDLWLHEQEKLFGSSVELIPAYRWGWTYISHFIHSRFYCYSYSFGELLTLALFQRYLDEGDAFVPGYMALLESGGSRRPEQALAQLGVDINQPEFWDRGFRVIEGFLTDLRQTLG
ncbi:MAG TPA: M3 family oligoendopeptidase [Candidatus Binatia bacterium]|nr:M3 family oligoendopeptidase [Candidatus Binatia bacterium]